MEFDSLDLIAQLEEEQRKLTERLNLIKQQGAIASKAVSEVHDAINQTTGEVKAKLLVQIIKMCEQEAKKSGLDLAATSVQLAYESNKSNRKKEEILKPEQFAKISERLGVDGSYDAVEGTVSYRKIYIGCNGIRNTAACPGSTSIWKAWLFENLQATDIKVGTPWLDCELQGLYLIEVSDLPMKGLVKLFNLDFSKSPHDDYNITQMERDYPNLTFVAEEETPQSEEIIEEEIMEDATVKIVEPKEEFLPIGTIFTVQNIQGYEGTGGQIVGVNPGTEKPYECQVTGFKYNPLLTRDQINIHVQEYTSVSSAEEKEEELDLQDIPF